MDEFISAAGEFVNSISSAVKYISESLSGTYDSLTQYFAVLPGEWTYPLGLFVTSLIGLAVVRWIT